MEKNGHETPSKHSLGSDTQDLYIGIAERTAPILVSKPIFYNYVYRRHNWNDSKHLENQTLKGASLSKEEWDLYVPVDTKYFADEDQLYLLLPKSQKNLFTAEIFNVAALGKLDILPTQEEDDYTMLLESLKPKVGHKLKEKSESKKNVKGIVLDLKKIFATFPVQSKAERSLAIHRKEAWQAPIWDIYLAGHGDLKPDTLIASLTPLEMQELLTFFNDFIQVGVLIISSCYAGGNLEDIKFKKDINNDKALQPLNFITIVNSVGDIPTYGATQTKFFITNKFFFAKLFDITQNLGNDAQHSLQHLLSIVGEYNKTPQDIHAQASIPQIILPGGWGD